MLHSSLSISFLEVFEDQQKHPKILKTKGKFYFCCKMQIKIQQRVM